MARKKQAKKIIEIKDLNEFINPVISSGDFSAKLGSTTLVYLSKKKEKRLLILGIGEYKKCTLNNLRLAYAAFIKRCHGKKWNSVNVVLPKVKNIKDKDVCSGNAGYQLGNQLPGTAARQLPDP